MVDIRIKSNFEQGIECLARRTIEHEAHYNNAAVREVETTGRVNDYGELAIEWAAKSAAHNRLPNGRAMLVEEGTQEVAMGKKPGVWTMAVQAASGNTQPLMDHIRASAAQAAAGKKDTLYHQALEAFLQRDQIEALAAGVSTRRR